MDGDLQDKDISLLTSDPNSYEVMGELGKITGLIGNVILVRHHKTNSLLAAKQYELDKLTSEQADAIQFEVNLAKQLSHPNILPCIASYVWEQKICILSPLMDFGSCHDLINSTFIDGFPELAIAFIIKDTLQGLDYIHKQGFILRSIKGSHILLSGQGIVKISGLRYACSMIKNGKWERFLHDFPEALVPNLNWLSPEILEQNLTGYNEKSDVYSIGITLCEMANGIIPFSNIPPLLMLTEKLESKDPQLLDRFSLNGNINDRVPSGVRQVDSGVGGSVENSGIDIIEKREFSEPFHNIVKLCLLKDQNLRPSPSHLLNHPFFKQCKRSPSLMQVILPIIDGKNSSAPMESHENLVTEMAADKLSELQLNSFEWNL